MLSWSSLVHSHVPIQLPEWLIVPTGNVYVVHFRDMRLWSNAVLLYDKVTKVRALSNVVIMNDILSPRDIWSFYDMCINATLLRFRSLIDIPTVTGLAELLDENWLGDRILTARSEIVMDQVNALGKNKLLILPPLFYTQLSNAYHADHFSQALKCLRDSLLADLPSYVAFAYNKGQVHWAPCIVSMKDRIVMQGDSLGWDVDADMLNKVKWFLRDIANVQGKWMEVFLDVP